MQMSDNTTRVSEIDPDLDAPSEPRTLIFHLQQSTKARYDQWRRSPDVVARKPFGFLLMRNGGRSVFIADHGKYYEGWYPDYYSVENFQKAEKKDARVFTSIGLKVVA
jgi:hypothetical protein